MNLGSPSYYHGASAFGMGGTVAIHHHIAEPQPAPPPRPGLILPSRVQEQVDAERRRRRTEAMFMDMGPTRRPLTDEECIERWGADKAELRESMRYWEQRAALLPWWRRKARREARHERARATAVCLAAQEARTLARRTS